MSENKAAAPQQDLNEILKVRREKLKTLQESGKDPFEITKYDVTTDSVSAIKEFSEREAELTEKGEEMTEAEMKKYIADHMARHKVPRYIEFVSAFPMNAAGKILKYKMRENAEKKFCKD